MNGLKISDRPEVKAINIGLIQTKEGYQGYMVGSLECDYEG
jgi:hypothetical protein